MTYDTQTDQTTTELIPRDVALELAHRFNVYPLVAEALGPLMKETAEVIKRLDDDAYRWIFGRLTEGAERPHLSGSGSGDDPNTKTWLKESAKLGGLPGETAQRSLDARLIAGELLASKSLSSKDVAEFNAVQERAQLDAIHKSDARLDRFEQQKDDARDKVTAAAVSTLVELGREKVAEEHAKVAKTIADSLALDMELFEELETWEEKVKRLDRHLAKLKCQNGTAGEIASAIARVEDAKARVRKLDQEYNDNITDRKAARPHLEQLDSALAWFDRGNANTVTVSVTVTAPTTTAPGRKRHEDLPGEPPEERKRRLNRERQAKWKAGRKW